MIGADQIPPEFWALLGAVVALAGSALAILGRQLEKTSSALESLQESMVDKAVPAIERGMAFAQLVQPIIEQNAVALGANTEALKASAAATADMVSWVRVLSDRESRPPPRRGN